MSSTRIRPFVFGFSALAISTLFSTTALAHEAQVGPVLVIHPWVQPTDRDNAPIFMRVINGGGDVQIVGASTTRSERAELMRAAGQMSSSLAIEASGELVLQPGGSHVMAISLDGPLAAGETVPLIITLQDGTVVELEAAVEVEPTHR